mmetsp:Transcript_30566/g.50809  ORF Transcript_30566/g.50809 Transcript_30566/m.50809 type:complete len:85 (+) Transcript_30566:782-1036(+)
MEPGPTLRLRKLSKLVPCIRFRCTYIDDATGSNNMPLGGISMRFVRLLGDSQELPPDYSSGGNSMSYQAKMAWRSRDSSWAAES